MKQHQTKNAPPQSLIQDSGFGVEQFLFALYLTRIWLFILSLTFEIGLLVQWQGKAVQILKWACGYYSPVNWNNSGLHWDCLLICQASRREVAETNALTAKLQLGAIRQDHVMLRTATELTLKVTPIPIISRTSTVIISVWTIHMAKNN